MSILSDSAILEAMKRGDIVIEPFDRECLGSNSYDVHLGNTLLTYDRRRVTDTGGFYVGNLREPLDCAMEHSTWPSGIPDNGFTLRPGVLYLGATLEYTETRGYVPFLDGKSSVGRLGIFIHATAGRGDSGFKNHWTCELSVVEPVRVYVGMPIGQLIYHTIEGEVLRPHDTKPFSTQRTERTPLPVPSGLWKNFPLKKRG